MCSTRELLSEGIRRLEAAGVPTPRLDAELLLAQALGVRRLDLHAHPERVPEPEEAARWEVLLTRRRAREPLPYIRGEVEFYGLPFRVGPSVLIPRPETEILVEAVARRMPPNAVILDVGTGSGCIALALAHTLPTARIYGLDPSESALALAEENASALGLQTQVTWIRGTWQDRCWVLGAGCSVLSEEAARRKSGVPSSPPSTQHPAPSTAFHAIVANPPYIPSAEVDRLEPELRLYEPRLALDGGPDGLCLIRSLLEEGWRLLKPGGVLALEMALGQDETVRDLAASVPEWREVSVLPDLAGIPRVLLVQWRS
jgi:release factor glutamine methyltransferase